MRNDENALRGTHIKIPASPYGRFAGIFMSVPLRAFSSYRIAIMRFHTGFGPMQYAVLSNIIVVVTFDNQAGRKLNTGWSTIVREWFPEA